MRVLTITCLATLLAACSGNVREAPPVAANAAIDVDGDRAEVRSDYVFLAFVDGALAPALAGRYHDQLRRVGGRWLFERREARPFTAPTVDRA